MTSISKMTLAGVATAGLLVALANQMQAERPPVEPASPPPAPAIFPSIAEPELVAASLEALRGHGWELALPLLSKHTVLCRDLETCGVVGGWARENGFTPREPLTSFGHGGAPQYSIDFVCRCVLSPEEVHRQGREIFDAMLEIPGAIYVTWMAERVQ